MIRIIPALKNTCKKLFYSDVSLRRRIDLIQDFDMPTVNTRVHVSNDGQYVYTSGTYKPR